MEFNSRKRLNLEFETLLETNNPEFRFIFFFIRRSLKQFRLDNYYNEIDVLAETYIRAIKYVDTQQQDIKNPRAWIKVTSYNVIREMSRKQKKEQANSELVELQVAPDNCEKNNEVELNILKTSLQDLSEKDRQILELRFFQDLSWRQVVSYLASTGEILTEANARQRGNRALQRLRKAFLSIKSDKLSD